MGEQLNARDAARRIAKSMRAYVVNSLSVLSARIDELRDAGTNALSIADVRAEIDKSAKKFVVAQPRVEPTISAAAISAIVQPLLDAAVARYELELERRITGALEKAASALPAPRDGNNGVDGKDGASLESLRVEAIDGGRVLLFSVRINGVVTEHKVITAMMIDRGIYSAGVTHAEGDVVTHSGSCWVAQQSTSEKPGESPHWRLMVKKGRDGRDATGVQR